MNIFDLKTFRLSKTRHTQEEFAKILMVSKGTIGKIEAGHTNPSDRLLIKIEESFSVNLNEYKSWNRKEQAASIVSETEAQYITMEKIKLMEMLEKCHSDKDDLQKRVLELEKQLLKKAKPSQAKTGK